MPSRKALVVALDVILINLGFWLSYLIRYRLGIPYPVEPAFFAPFTPFIPYAAMLTLLCLITYQIDGLYEQRRGRRLLDELYRLANGTMTSIVISMALTFILQPLFYSRGMLILGGAIIVGLLGLERVALYLVLAARRRRGIGVQRVLVVGAGEIGRAVMRTILGDPALGYSIVGYVDDDPAKAGGELGRIKGLGTLAQIAQVAVGERIDEVIVTLPWMYHRQIMQIVEECERRDLRVRVVPDVFQQRMHHVDVESLNGIPLIGPGPTEMKAGARLIKRLIDLTLTVLALPFLTLLFAVVALLIKLDSPGPVIFKHRRVGTEGREFFVYKFRSMIDGAENMQADLTHLNEADGPLFKIEDDPRLTRVGRFLRRASIDELPQLINVLKGEMSLVGPRPGTPEEVAQYESWQHRRLNAWPGITGLWQVSGRSDVPFAEMCLLDIYYIENWSLDLDIRILLQTIPHVLARKGAY